MAEKDKEEDIFALTKPNGSPAYPKMVYTPTGDKYPDGSDITTAVIVKDPDEHKAHLANQKNASKKSDKPEGWK